MKKALILTAALLVCAAPAFAGLDVTWGNCGPEGGTSDVVFNCGNPSGLYTLFGEVSSPVTITGFVNMDIIMDIQADAAALPPFYSFQDPVLNTTGCNAGYIFEDARPAATCGGTGVLWGPVFNTGQLGTPVIGFAPGGTPIPNAPADPARGRWKGTIFRPATQPTTLNASTRYFGFQMQLFTALAGSCAGCSTPIQWVWNEASLGSVAAVTGVEAAPVIVTDPGNVSNQATINGGGGIPPGATPTQNKSWGALKSLYR